MLRNEANYRVHGTVKNSKTLALSQLIEKKRNKILSSVLYFVSMRPSPGGTATYGLYRYSMCRCEGYVFQAVYPGIGYINQRVWV